MEEDKKIEDLVSIVMPTYKRPQYLKEAIESVLNQTYENWELLIIDDNEPASEEQKWTEKVITGYRNDNRIRYIREGNPGGGAAARNRGISKACGEFVAFLDDDDIWEPDKLQLQLEVLKKNRDIGLVYCKRFFFNDKGERDNRSQKKLIRGNVFEQMLVKNYIATSTAMVRKECFGKVGLFDEKLPSQQDHDMFLRIARYYKVGLVDKSLTGMRLHSARISRNTEGKLRGWEFFLAKWKPILKDYPRLRRQAYSHYHFEMGKVYYYHGNLELARQHLSESVKYNCFHYKSWVLLFLSVMGYKTRLK